MLKLVVGSLLAVCVTKREVEPSYQDLTWLCVFDGLNDGQCLFLYSWVIVMLDQQQLRVLLYLEVILYVQGVHLIVSVLYLEVIYNTKSPVKKRCCPYLEVILYATSILLVVGVLCLEVTTCYCVGTAIIESQVLPSTFHLHNTLWTPWANFSGKFTTPAQTSGPHIVATSP